MKSFSNYKKGQLGFTLLEILVVISIIGILIVLGASAFSVAQRKGRDARRLGDMKAMQNAFEQYYANTGSVYAACNTMATTTFSSGVIPTDPKGTYSCTGNATTYCACALLESGTGNSGAGCSYVGTTHYCVSNLQ